MAGFQGGNDALVAAQVVESGQGFVVIDGDVFGAADVLQITVFRTDAGVVQAGGNGMGFDDLAVGILHQVGAEAVQHAGGAGG